MKIRQAFVANSSSSSFLLTVEPISITEILFNSIYKGCVFPFIIGNQQHDVIITDIINYVNITSVDTWKDVERFCETFNYDGVKVIPFLDDIYYQIKSISITDYIPENETTATQYQNMYIGIYIDGKQMMVHEFLFSKETLNTYQYTITNIVNNLKQNGYCYGDWIKTDEWIDIVSGLNDDGTLQWTRYEKLPHLKHEDIYSSDYSGLHVKVIDGKLYEVDVYCDEWTGYEITVCGELINFRINKDLK
jgi:hypothetical protein